MSTVRHTIAQLTAGSLRLLGGTLTRLADFCAAAAQAKIASLKPEPGVWEELSFPEAMTWLTNNKPTSASVCRAALLRESASAGYKISFFYLDGRDQIVTDDAGVPVGRVIITRHIDDELFGYFADQPLVVFA